MIRFHFSRQMQRISKHTVRICAFYQNFSQIIKHYTMTQIHSTSMYFVNMMLMDIILLAIFQERKETWITISPAFLCFPSCKEKVTVNSQLSFPMNFQLKRADQAPQKSPSPIQAIDSTSHGGPKDCLTFFQSVMADLCQSKNFQL